MPEIDWKAYDRWNNAIAGHLFCPDNAGRPVYLDVEDDMLAALGPEFGVSPGDAAARFRSDVAATLVLTPGSQRSFLFWHKPRVYLWKKEAKVGTLPPFVALLALFCNVAEQMRTVGDIRANNYYTPLTKALGLPLKESYRQRVARGFQEAEYLWRELNRWLEDLGGRYGLPTANPLDRRVHIGFPLSQALLRESDHRALTDLFTAYGFRPHQEILPQDLQRLMDKWVRYSPVSSVVKRLWQNVDAQRKIAEIAATDLLAWDGAVREPTHEGTSAIIELLCTFFSRPRPRIDFDFAVRSRPDLPFGLYKVKEAPVPLEDGGALDELRLSPGLYQEWCDSLPRLSVPDMLLRRAKFSLGDSISICWQPRRLLIFQRDDTMMCFCSQPRMELNKPSMLLVHERLANGVARSLEGCVQPGMQSYTAAQVEGLPDGWHLFTDVFLIGVPDPAGDFDVSTLVPYSWTRVCFQ